MPCATDGLLNCHMFTLCTRHDLGALWFVGMCHLICLFASELLAFFTLCVPITLQHVHTICIVRWTFPMVIWPMDEEASFSWRLMSMYHAPLTSLLINHLMLSVVSSRFGAKLNDWRNRRIWQLFIRYCENYSISNILEP